MAQNIATTDAAREQYAEALAGEIELPDAQDIAFGSGGHDSSDDPIDIDTTWTSVPEELLKKELDSVDSDAYVCDMLGVLEQDELVGETISAAGIYDSEDTLIAVATFSPIPKGDDDRIEFDWNTAF